MSLQVMTRIQMIFISSNTSITEIFTTIYGTMFSLVCIVGYAIHTILPDLMLHCETEILFYGPTRHDKINDKINNKNEKHHIYKQYNQDNVLFDALREKLTISNIDKFFFFSQQHTKVI